MTSCKCPHCAGTGVDPAAFSAAKDIVARVAAQHGVDVKDMADLGRFWKWENRFHARWHAAWELVAAGFTKVATGKILGYRDHTTVVYACKQWAKLAAK